MCGNSSWIIAERDDMQPLINLVTSVMNCSNKIYHFLSTQIGFFTTTVVGIEKETEVDIKPVNQADKQHRR